MKSVAAIAMTVLVVPIAQAHFVWLEMDPARPDAILLRFSEEPREATPAELQKNGLRMEVRTPENAPLTFAVGDDAAESEKPVQAPYVSGSMTYGLFDRGETPFKLVYHAKGAQDAEAAAEIAGLPVEIVAEATEETLTLTVLHKGKPAHGAEIVAVLPHELETVEGTTDSDGKVSFPLPKTGWVGIRAMVSVNESGEIDGTPYSEARHYSTLAFKHDGA